jgi:nicotinamide riboside kinase
LLIGCAKPQPHYVLYPDYIKDAPSPTDMELVVSDAHRISPHQESSEHLEARYQESLVLIDTEFANEQKQLDACQTKNHGQICETLRAEFCAIDTWMDAKGYSHIKPFCQ